MRTSRGGTAAFPRNHLRSNFLWRRNSVGFAAAKHPHALSFNHSITARLAHRMEELREAGIGWFRDARPTPALAAVLMLTGGFVHGSRNCEDLHPEIAPFAASIPHETRELPELRVMLKAGFGFGDVNAALVLRKWEDPC